MAKITMDKRKDDVIRLWPRLDAAHEAILFAKGKTREDLNSAHPETVIFPDDCVMLKILSSEYQPYACGKISRMPGSQPKSLISGRTLNNKSLNLLENTNAVDQFWFHSELC